MSSGLDHRGGFSRSLDVKMTVLAQVAVTLEDSFSDFRSMYIDQ